MIRTLPISLIAVAMTLTASAQGQVTQPGAQPQPVPHTPTPGFHWDQQYPRMRRQGPPTQATPIAPGPTAPGPNGPGPNVPGPNAATDPGPAPNTPIPPRRPTLSTFVIPTGLSEPIEYLLLDLGYQSGKTFPLTPHTTFDLAYKCYADGRYDDAIVFASHGLRMCNDARLHLIKGVCELHQGHGTAAEMIAVDFRNAIAGQQVFGLDAARERINDARAARFADIVEYQVTGH